MRKEADLYFLNHFGWFCFAFITLIILSYYYLDAPLALYFHAISISHSLLIQSLNYLIHPLLHLFLWPLLFYFFRFLLKREYVANRFLFISLALDFCNLCVYLLKMFFGRLRPELLFSAHQYGFSFFALHDPYLSFPSGHAISCAAVFASFACIYPRYFYYFFCSALIISFARVVSTEHFFSDILASIFLGFLITELVYFPMRKSSLVFFKE